jgi:hypothetical protein
MQIPSVPRRLFKTIPELCEKPSKGIGLVAFVIEEDTELFLDFVVGVFQFPRYRVN